MLRTLIGGSTVLVATPLARRWGARRMFAGGPLLTAMAAAILLSLLTKWGALTRRHRKLPPVR